MYLWNTHRLAEALGRQELTSADKFIYLLLNHVIYAAAGYVAWLFVRSSSGWIFWFEGLVLLAITVVGLMRCRERYASATHDRFVEDCFLLQTPLSLKYFVFFWLAHVSVSYFLVWLLPMLKIETIEDANLVDHIIKSIYSIYPFFMVFVGAALFYIRLSLHLETAARAQTLS